MPDLKETARRQGWQDKDLWVANGGDPTLWRDADEFLAVGEIINTRAKRYDQLLADSEARHRAELGQQHKRIEALQKGLIRTSQREYERAKARLKMEIKAATEDGDTAAVDRLLGDMDELDKNREETAKLEAETAVQEPPPDGVPQEVNEWIVGHPWVNAPSTLEDRYRLAVVDQAAHDLKVSNPNASGADVVKALDAALEAYEKGQKPMDTPPKTTEIPPQVHTPRQLAGGEHYGPKDNGDKSWSSLPEEARIICEDLQKRGDLPAGEEGRKMYAENYVWDDYQRGARGIHA